MARVLRLILLLLIMLAVIAYSSNHNRHHKRHRRNNDLHDWLTSEQKAQLKDLAPGSGEFKKKVGEFYSQLPKEKRREWDRYYKKHCFEWTAKVQSADEEAKFQKSLEANDLAAVKERFVELKKKLGDEERKPVEMWEEDCYKLVKPESRRRRELAPVFKQFMKWMTPEQIQEIHDMKASDKSDEVIHAKTKEFFGLLTLEKQKELRDEFKGYCKTYFTPLMTEEETAKIKTLAGKHEEAGALVKGIVDRQDGDVKKTSHKMFLLCGEVYKDSSRKRRDLDAAFKDFLTWMTPEQVAEISGLKESGKSPAEIKAKTIEFFEKLPSDQQKTLKEDFKGKCKAYFTPLLNEEESEKLKGFVAAKDKEAAGELMKKVVERQDGGDKKVIAGKMLELCGEVYKDASKKKREIDSGLKDFVKWMTPEQLAEITEMKTAGKSDDELRTKTISFFDALPADRQNELKTEFKGKCKTYFTPLMTPEELEKIKTVAGDKEAAGALIKGVVDRQDGDAKVLAGKMFGICGEVYKDGKRLRREIDDGLKDFVKWMTPEQLAEIQTLQASGKSDDELRQKSIEFFDALPVDRQLELKTEFKGKCKEYFTPLMTPEELATAKNAKGDKTKMEKVAMDVVGRQEGEKKVLAQKMVGICKAAFNEETRQRRSIDSGLKDFVKWMTPEQLAEIQELKTAGKSDADLRAKTLEYFEALPKDRQTEVKDELKGACRVNFKKLMTDEEEAEIQKIKDDKPAAISLIRKVVDRQEGEVKVLAEKLFGICGEVYKDARKRRALSFEDEIKKFVHWMTDDQKTEIKNLKASGASDTDLHIKTKEYFGSLPADKQKELKDEFKGHCKTYFTPLMTEEELAKIKEVKGDKEAAGALMNGVVGRQAGDQKVVSEKMLWVCSEIYKEAARLRREIDDGMKDFVKWMTPEQLVELNELKTSGKSDAELRAKTIEYFEALPKDRQVEVKNELKGSCRVYFKKLMTDEEEVEIQKIKDDKPAAISLIRKVVDRQEGEVKVLAEKMFGACGEVYKEAARMRREIDSGLKDFVAWMTPEQLAEITEMKTSGKSDDELRTKTVSFFDALPADRQNELKTEFKGKCKTYFTPLMTPEELEKIKTVAGDKEAAGALIKGVVDRQDGDAKVLAGKMFGICGEVYKDGKRMRREIDAGLKDFVKWMTTEQLAELNEMKTAGKPDADLSAKSKQFFDALPSERQKELREELKGTCKAYFKNLMTETEQAEIKAIKDDKTAAVSMVRKVVDRQEGEVKKLAEKLFNVCTEVYKDGGSKKKRDVKDSIQKHLAWLTGEEKAEILKMIEDKASKEDIRAKIDKYIEAYDKDPVRKADTIKKCYAWMDEVATKEEIESLHKLHHVDHGACKKKVREFIGKLPADKKATVEENLPFCEKLWYGGHKEHEGEHQHHSHHKRHIVVIEKFIDWMNDEQKVVIKTMENGGDSFEKISEKIREYFGTLPMEKQVELKEQWKNQCMIWAKEVSLPAEWEEIKKYYTEKDHGALKTKLVELEGRLTENQKHTIEHVRGVCYKLWGMDTASRLRRTLRSNRSEYSMRSARM